MYVCVIFLTDDKSELAAKFLKMKSAKTNLSDERNVAVQSPLTGQGQKTASVESEVRNPSGTAPPSWTDVERKPAPPTHSKKPPPPAEPKGKYPTSNTDQPTSFQAVTSPSSASPKSSNHVLPSVYENTQLTQPSLVSGTTETKTSRSSTVAVADSSSQTSPPWNRTTTDTASSPKIPSPPGPTSPSKSPLSRMQSEPILTFPVAKPTGKKPVQVPENRDAGTGVREGALSTSPSTAGVAWRNRDADAGARRRLPSTDGMGLDRSPSSPILPSRGLGRSASLSEDDCPPLLPPPRPVCPPAPIGVPSAYVVSTLLRQQSRVYRRRTEPNCTQVLDKFWIHVFQCECSQSTNPTALNSTGVRELQLNSVQFSSVRLL